MYESQHQQAQQQQLQLQQQQQQQQQQQDDNKHHHHSHSHSHFHQQLIQATHPEPNTYDYASQLMFDANAFASSMNHHQHPMDLNSATAVHVTTQQQAVAAATSVAAAHPTGSYLDFLPTNSSSNDPYEMFRYQNVMQQGGSDYTSTSYQQQQQQATYPMMAFHTMNSQSSLENSNYPTISYDHHNYMFQNGPPMPTLSTSSSSSSSLSSTNTSSTAAAYNNNNDNRGAQVYVRKACVSCKQSHVACDVQRPCARCVRLNKADTCVDAERKKRGRPCGSSKKKKENALMVNGGGVGMSTATAASALAANMLSYL